MSNADTNGSIMPYWSLYTDGVWRGWWYDPDTNELVMHEFADIDDSLPMADQKQISLKRTRFEIVRRYGVERILGEVDP